MLIKFSELVAKYGKPKGIIHIGAHMMEERLDYLSFGLDNTIWCEANPSLFGLLNVQLQGTKEKLLPYAICDVSDSTLKLNLANNGQSSSILELEKHKIYHPDVHYFAEVEVTTKRMDDLIRENNIDIDDYDFLNIDIQGAELLALKGFGKLLENIKFIYTEVNKEHLYKDCALLEELDLYLKSYGFNRMELSLTPFQWGDAFYVKFS